MDAYLAVISKRDVREYRDAPLPEEQLERILQAGRATGSSQNRQLWRFVLVTDRSVLADLAKLVSRPNNLLGCAAAIAVVVKEGGQGFDAGRVAQNMMVAAWADGVGSCPNGCRDQQRAREILGLADGGRVRTIVTFGYPKRRYNSERSDADAILGRIQRKPLQEIVKRI